MLQGEEDQRGERDSWVGVMLANHSANGISPWLSSQGA